MATENPVSPGPLRLLSLTSLTGAELRAALSALSDAERGTLADIAADPDLDDVSGIDRIRLAFTGADPSLADPRVWALEPNTGARWRADKSLQTQALSEHLDEALGPFAVGPDGETLWAYNPDTGVYEAHADRRLIAPALERIFANAYRGTITAYVVEQLRARCTGVGRILTLDPQQQERWIICRNGALEWRTGILHPHSPAHMATIAIPVIYDPSVECPRVDRFHADVFGEDQELVHLWHQVLGSCLYAGEPRWQKAIICVGDGSNGKSKALDLLLWLVGSHNVAKISPQQLDSERFAAAGLAGKLANVANDASANAFKDTGMWKKVVAGDPITADAKYMQPFNFRPIATQIASYNRLPATQDTTRGFFRRMLIIPFDEVFVPGAPIGRQRHAVAGILDAILLDESERSGLLNRALTGLQQLMLANAGRFSEPQRSRELSEQYKIDADPVRGYIASGRVHRAPMEVGVPRTVLYRDYVGWCEETDQAKYALGPKAFGLQFAAAAADVPDPLHVEQRRATNPDQMMVYGVSLEPLCGICQQPLTLAYSHRECSDQALLSF